MDNNEFRSWALGLYDYLYSKALPLKRKERLNRFEISLNEYEVLISERSYVKGTELSTRRLRRMLKWLNENGYITLNPTNKGTIIKINDPRITADHLETKHKNES